MEVRGAFSCRSLRLVSNRIGLSKRVKEVVKEILTASGADPVIAAEGAIKFMERVNPAFMNVDGSFGEMGATIARAVKLRRPYINLMFGEKTWLVLAV